MAKAKSQFGYTPAPGRLIVESLESSDRTESGLYVPESVQDSPQLGKVIAYTPSRRDDGSENDALVKVGDTIVHSKYGGSSVSLDGETFMILREDDILAVKG